MLLGRIAGIDLKIHWSFWALVGFYLISTSMAAGLAQGAFSVVLIGSVFACVVAHEYGHAAAAAYYKIRTADITIFAFGGLARLTKLPDRPMHELVIAVAGPAVNVVIAAVLFLLILAGILPTGLLAEVPGGAGDEMAVAAAYSFWDMLLATNLFLVAFNLLPAFPMDGGRVLRSLLAMRKGQLRATEIAARAGRWMALLFLVLGIFYSFSLVLIAAFIFVAGTAELMQVRLRQHSRDMAARGYPGGDAGADFPFGPHPGGAGFGGAGFGPGFFHTTWQFDSSAGAASGQDPARPTGSDDPGVVDAVDVKQIQ